MKIWVLEIGEPLPLEKGVRLHRYGKFTDYLAKQGHEVTWWTSSFSHAPKSHFADQTQIISLKKNLRLYVIRGPGYPRNISFKRFAHQADFGKKFLELSKKEEKPDLIVAPIPTLEGAEAAIVYAVENQVRSLVDVRDCWPAEFVDILPKPLRFLGPIILRSMFKKAKFACSHAAAIVGVSESYRDYGLAFSGRNKTALDQVMPLGYQQEQLGQEQIISGTQWAKKIGLKPEHFIVCFFGTIGRFFDLDAVIQAAQMVKDKPIQFLLAGDGSSLERYRKRAAQLENVIFPGWINEEQIQAAMRMASVGIAPYVKGANMSMPNKPFEYMAGGLPVLYTFHGELASQLAQQKCGFHYAAEDSVDLTAKILQLFNNEELRESMGQNARQLFTKNYSLEIVFPKFEALISQIVKANLP